ncbi:MAG: KEOPS complex subunit Cgi121 [Halodesulfurarchaeum sp.]|nr:KEOPS complex subunit Cgi121 [Halodesulfurarchaeum sp.]
MKTVTGRVAIGRDDARADETKPAPAAQYESLDEFLEALRAVSQQYDVLLQAFDARYIAGTAHLRAALEHAKRSMARGENVADELAVEVLLYAAGRRQIDRAMELGLGTGDQSVIVLLAGDRETEAATAVRDLIEPGPVEPDEAVIAEYFEITPAERRATTGDLADLVCERVALLDVER